MIQYTIILADLLVIAKWQQEQENYKCTFTDTFTGKAFNATVSPCVYAAILAFMVEPEPPNMDELYETIGNLFDNCPLECRPIP